jgi:hypothetical protein
MLGQPMNIGSSGYVSIGQRTTIMTARIGSLLSQRLLALPLLLVLYAIHVWVTQSSAWR